ncbi:hypothetical protein C8Q79DRAFT_925674 [Trametes meyenii]|nr:hypothetical protein C8Q79DRAFT_925674 [Trametes meyenii]
MPSDRDSSSTYSASDSVLSYATAPFTRSRCPSPQSLEPRSLKLMHVAPGSAKHRRTTAARADILERSRQSKPYDRPSSGSTPKVSAALLFRIPTKLEGQCDFCRPRKVSVCSANPKGLRCNQCVLSHRRCTFGGIGTDGEIYEGKGQTRIVRARFNGVGFSIVKHATPNWPATFELVERATAFLREHGVTVLRPDVLEANTADCYVEGAHPTKWRLAAQVVLLGRYGARFRSLPDTVFDAVPAPSPPRAPRRMSPLNDGRRSVDAEPLDAPPHVHAVSPDVPGHPGGLSVPVKIQASPKPEGGKSTGRPVSLGTNCDTLDADSESILALLAKYGSGLSYAGISELQAAVRRSLDRIMDSASVPPGRTAAAKQ